MEKILTPEHEAMLVEVGKIIREHDLSQGKRGKRGWKSAACRLAIEALYVDVVSGDIDIEAMMFYVKDKLASLKKNG